MLDYWQAELIPGVWLQGPEIPELVSDCWGGGRFLTQFIMGRGVSQKLHWPASGQGQVPAGPRVGSNLLLADSFHSLWGHSFLASGICPLVGEAGLEAYTGFMVGKAGACPLVGGPGSWPSGGQGHVLGHV